MIHSFSPLTPYSIYLRAGLIEYLQERCPKAVEWFEKAKPFAPPRDLVVVHGTIPTGIEKLIELAKSGRYITPDEVRKGDATAKLILMLADVYHEGEEWQRSLDLCTHVIEPKGFKVTNQQKSWAFFKRGRAHFRNNDEGCDPDGALRDYVASRNAAPQAPWAPKAMFLGANLLWNEKHDPDGAVSVWRTLLRSYPECGQADTSAYYIGVVYEWSDRPELAAAAFREILDKRPGSRFRQCAIDHLRDLQSQSPRPPMGKPPPSPR